MEGAHAETLSFQALQQLDAAEAGLHLLMEAAESRHSVYSVRPFMSSV